MMDDSYDGPLLQSSHCGPYTDQMCKMFCFFWICKEFYRRDQLDMNGDDGREGQRWWTTMDNNDDVWWMMPGADHEDHGYLGPGGNENDPGGGDWVGGAYHYHYNIAPSLPLSPPITTSSWWFIIMKMVKWSSDWGLPVSYDGTKPQMAIVDHSHNSLLRHTYRHHIFPSLWLSWKVDGWPAAN